MTKAEADVLIESLVYETSTLRTRVRRLEDQVKELSARADRFAMKPDVWAYSIWIEADDRFKWHGRVSKNGVSVATFAADTKLGAKHQAKKLIRRGKKIYSFERHEV